MGKRRTPEYDIWSAMIQRCCNPKNRAYMHYGGRGIAICPAWRASFDAFVVDLGLRPSQDHSLECRDNDGPYSPDNCKWATRIEQGNNTRRNKVLTWRGETLTITDWARRLNIPSQTLYSRLRLQWPVDRILSVESVGRSQRGRHNGSVKVTPQDVTTIRQLAAAGALHRELAMQFGIGHTQVARIINRQLWKHVA